MGFHQVCEVLGRPLASGKPVVKRSARSSRKIETRDAVADAGDKVGSHGADAASDDVCGVYMVAVGTIDSGDIADGGVGDVGDVEHAYVHRDNADDGRLVSANVHATVIS